MTKLIKEKFKESIASIILAMIIMILISTLLLIIGVTLFTFELDLSMMKIGKTGSIII